MGKKSPEIEEYLEALARYKESGREPRVKGLARDLGITAASVSQMLRRLSGKGLVKCERYGRIMLTKRGEEAGRTVLRKHRLIERFLALIGIRRSRIHDEACVLEHAVSDEVEDALRKMIRRPGEAGIKAKDVKRLIDMRGGETGTILLIAGGRRSCRRLADMGLTPGSKVAIYRASSRMGPIEVRVHSSCLAIGRGLAEKIFVRVGR